MTHREYETAFKRYLLSVTQSS